MGIALCKCDFVPLPVPVSEGKCSSLDVAPAEQKLLPQEEELPKSASGWLELTVTLTDDEPNEKVVVLSNGQEYTKRACYLRAAELDPDCFLAWNNFGTTFATSNEGITASNGHLYTQRECFHRAVELDPNSATAWNNLGSAYFLVEDREDLEHVRVADCYQRALALDPKYSRAWNNLGLLLWCISSESILVNGERCTKRACFQHALELSPSYSAAWNNAGTDMAGNETVHLMVSGRPFDRKTCYQRAVESDPMNVVAWGNLHQILNREEIVSVNGQCLTKRSSILRVMALDPKNPMVSTETQ